MFNCKDNYLINEVFEYIKFKTTENIKYNDILVSVYEKYLHTLIMKIININSINQLLDKDVSKLTSYDLFINKMKIINNKNIIF